jgi:hypothetical protein
MLLKGVLCGLLAGGCVAVCTWSLFLASSLYADPLGFGGIGFIGPAFDVYLLCWLAGGLIWGIVTGLRAPLEGTSRMADRER